MEFCPHCERYYDPDNETQPLCPECGHPYLCTCSDSGFPNDLFDGCGIKRTIEASSFADLTIGA